MDLHRKWQAPGIVFIKEDTIKEEAIKEETIQIEFIEEEVVKDENDTPVIDTTDEMVNPTESILNLIKCKFETNSCIPNPHDLKVTNHMAPKPEPAISKTSHSKTRVSKRKSSRTRDKRQLQPKVPFKVAEATAEAEKCTKLQDGINACLSLLRGIDQDCLKMKSCIRSSKQPPRGLLLLSVACTVAPFREKIASMDVGARELREFLQSSVKPDNYPPSEVMRFRMDLQSYDANIDWVKKQWMERVAKTCILLRRLGLKIDESELL